jgi:hypothetical protein
MPEAMAARLSPLSLVMNGRMMANIQLRGQQQHYKQHQQQRQQQDQQLSVQGAIGNTRVTSLQNARGAACLQPSCSAATATQSTPRGPFNLAYVSMDTNATEETYHRGKTHPS